MSELQDAGEAELIVAIGRRQEQALAEVYRRHANAVFGLALKVLRSRQDAHDLAQELFLHLWLHPERFDPSRGTLASYLLMQVHRRAVDLLRTETSGAGHEGRSVRTAQQSTYDLEREIIEGGGGDQILAAVRALTVEERVAIGLAYYGGYTCREAAALLDKPEGTIKSLIGVGLRRLRDALSQITEDDQ